MLDLSLRDAQYLLDLVVKNQEESVDHAYWHLQGILSDYVELKANPESSAPVPFDEDAN